MSDAVAGFEGSVSADTTNVDGAYSVDFSRVMAELESTTFADEDQRRVYGLGDVEFTISCLWDASDAGQTVLQDAIDNRDTVDIEYLVDGTNGYSAECIVTEESVSQAVDGRVESTYTCALADGSLTRV